MPLIDLPGYGEIERAYGQVKVRDFDEVVHLCYDRRYEEDREHFEYVLNIVMKGKPGLLELSLGNVVMFTLGRSPQIVGLEIEDITSQGWDRKKFKLFSIEYDDVLAYAESCRVSIPASLH